jgi:hypothetical protein
VTDVLGCGGAVSVGHAELLPNVKKTFEDDGSDTDSLTCFATKMSSDLECAAVKRLILFYFDYLYNETRAVPSILVLATTPAPEYPIVLIVLGLPGIVTNE